MSLLLIGALLLLGYLIWLLCLKGVSIQSLADLRGLLGLLAVLSFVFGHDLAAVGCLALLLYSFLRRE